MLIAQISDTHIGLTDKVAWTAAEAEGRLAEAVYAINAFRPAVDAVLATGDLVDDGTPTEYARLRPLLDRLAAPLYVIPGNHDDRSALSAAFADHGYLPPDGGFLHYTVEAYPVRLIGLDTHVPGEPHGEICAARLAWLAARLAERPTAPTLIFMHHPPFATGIAVMDAMGCRGAGALGALIARHAQVERVACGHVHRTVQRRWAGTVGCIAPSTAGQVDLALPDGHEVGYIHEPRGFLLHYWSEATGLVTHLRPIGDFARTSIRM